jgi:hypothetical protein
MDTVKETFVLNMVIKGYLGFLPFCILIAYSRQRLESRFIDGFKSR